LLRRVVLHVDLDYFYAQCEENVNPALRGKPVVVCVYSGRTEESGVVSTCNYEARKYGVKAGIPISHARRLLGTVDASFLPSNHPHYTEVSDRVMTTLETLGDTFEQAGIDEAYLELTSGTNGDVNRAESIAREIKQKIFEQEEITCSVGVAPNKLLAKIASDLIKPNGLTVIRPENVRSFLEELSVDRIPGVGKKTEEKLDQLKVKTVSQLATLDLSVLHENFGSALGSYLYKAARGEDDEPVEDREQPTQLSRIATLKRNTQDISEILPLLEDLANSATAKLAEKNMTCKTVSIIAILNDLSIHSKSRTLESPTFDTRAIAQTAKDLFGQFLHAEPAATVRRVGVKLSGLSGRSGQTDISKFLS
jgi:DNA polymerase IV (archaeal DinB-like DNA polymerase)